MNIWSWYLINRLVHLNVNKSSQSANVYKWKTDLIIKEKPSKVLIRCIPFIIVTSFYLFLMGFISNFIVPVVCTHYINTKYTPKTQS